ncbi:hypothetical protein FJ941_26075 [Mesorhizobium sp. B2-3-13]|nr:hypothetical protein FJ941_26075 [Mesorhizobium sp. B2-3-13]
MQMQNGMPKPGTKREALTCRVPVMMPTLGPLLAGIIIIVASLPFGIWAAGGHRFMKTPVGDYVIAWALPKPGEVEATQ